MSKSTKSHFSRRRPRSALLGLLLVVGTFWLAACGGPITPPSVVKVEIEQANPTLGVGATLTLSAKVTVLGGASKAVTWESSDEAVASVGDTGLVTALTAGTATVTATSVGAPTKTDSVVVTVVPVASAPTITAFGGSVVAGSQAQLTWTVTNATGVSLYSVNPADANDSALIGTYAGSSTGATVALPDSTHQAYRLDASNSTGADSADLAPLANVVVSNQDYDPYNLRGWMPDEPIPGTLRAIMAAAPAGAVIGFAANVVQIDVRGVDLFAVGGGAVDAHLILRQDVTISGPVGAPVRLQGVSAWRTGDPGDPFTYESRVVYVPTGVTATLENVVISGGTFIYTGAGIHNAGDLTVRGSIITDNRAFGSGGGVRNLPGATLTMIDSSITDNIAATLDSEIDVLWDIRGSGGTPAQFPGVNGWGGGLYNEGVATLTNVEVSGNSARQSYGGIGNVSAATLTLNSVTVDGNVANHVAPGYASVGPEDFSAGGGIANYATLTFTDGSITNNLAADQGGGLYHGVEAMTTIDGIDITGNTAGVPTITGFGGGIMHHFYTGEEANLVSTGGTLSGNLPQDRLDSDDGVRTLSVTPRPAGVPAAASLEGLKFR